MVGLGFAENKMDNDKIANAKRFYYNSAISLRHKDIEGNRFDDKKHNGTKCNGLLKLIGEDYKDNKKIEYYECSFCHEVYFTN